MPVTCRDPGGEIVTDALEAAEAELERLNRWLVQIHAALAEHGETETEIWVMRALERAMQGETT